MQVVTPVSVGRVVFPESHWLHVSDYIACTIVEYEPAEQLVQWGIEAQGTHGLRFEVLHVELELQERH